MVERIRMLLETRQLTPTQFADAIGIARPIVSHILSGRNKPSLEVVQRILAAMPDLAMPWLLNGAGPMQAATPATSVPAEPILQPASQVINKERVVNYSPPLITKGKSRGVAAQEQQSSTIAQPAAPSVANGPGPKRFAPVLSRLEPAPKAISPVPLPPIAAAAIPPVPANEPVVTPPMAIAPAIETDANPTAAALFASTEKPIRRIVIFYRDGSFADYQPE